MLGFWLVTLCLMTCHATILPDLNFRLPSVLSNHMVLQRTPHAARLWGQATPGNHFNLLLLAAEDILQLVTVVVTPSGTWSTEFSPMPAGTGYTIQFQVNDGITLHDISFGDVFWCAGQSNMGLPLHEIYGGSRYLAQADAYPHLKMFLGEDGIDGRYTPTIQFDFPPSTKRGTNKWITSTSQNFQDFHRNGFFSALCYLVGTQLYDFWNGTVPIGLMDTSIGGTSIILWTSPNANQICGTSSQFPLITPSTLYHSYLSPLLPFQISGFLWYQGEADQNGQTLGLYPCLQQHLIWELRQRHAMLPFFYVQIAATQGWTPTHTYAPIRLLQTQTLYLPLAFMISAIDTGDWQGGSLGSNHPRNKLTLAQRMVTAIKFAVYGLNVTHNGPHLQSVLITRQLLASTVTLALSFSGSNQGLQLVPTESCQYASPLGLCCQDPTNDLFTLILEDEKRVIVPLANITIASATIFLKVTLRPIIRVKTIEYANIMYPLCILHNSEGFPLTPLVWHVQ